MAATLIEYNEKSDVMSITKNGESIYYGDVYHFNKTPRGLASFLKELGLNVILRRNDSLENIHPHELDEYE